MKTLSTKFILLLLSLILGTDIVCSQNSISSERLTYQNLEVYFCDEDRDGYISVNVEEMEDYALQTIGIENDYFLEQILISTSNGNIHTVYSPSNNPYISTSCDFDAVFTDIAVNSSQQVFICGASISRVDEDCTMHLYNNSSFDKNALSFDDLDNLYVGYGIESYVHRFNVDDTSMSNLELWHDFEVGSSGGDFVLLNDKIYVSWKLPGNNYRLYEVTVNNNRDYISHIDLGQLPSETYGLASELGELYGVTPNKLFKIHLANFTFSNIIENSYPEDLWYGAAGLHEAIVFDTSSYLSLNDAENNINKIESNWTNTTPGGQTIYIKIENSYTGEYDIVLLDIIISNDPNVNLPLDVIKCSNNYATVFNLEQVSNQMQIDSNDDLIFTYYNFNPDSNDVSIPLPFQYQSAANTETLFVRVENNDGGCHLVYSFQIISKEGPNLLPLSNLQSPTKLDLCYFDINSNGYFDLNDIKNDIVLNGGNLEFTYYLSYLDAENNDAQLSNIHYLEESLQEIYIKATNEQGCYAISNFYLNRDCLNNNEKLSNLIFPKFITPNNDGHNDFWNIKGVSEKVKRNSRVIIFNRFGKQLFSFIPYSFKGWDGTYNGYPLPSSEYWFLFKTKSGAVKTGHFTLKK